MVASCHSGASKLLEAVQVSVPVEGMVGQRESNLEPEEGAEQNAPGAVEEHEEGDVETDAVLLVKGGCAHHVAQEDAVGGLR